MAPLLLCRRLCNHSFDAHLQRPAEKRQSGLEQMLHYSQKISAMLKDDLFHDCDPGRGLSESPYSTPIVLFNVRYVCQPRCNTRVQDTAFAAIMVSSPRPFCGGASVLLLLLAAPFLLSTAERVGLPSSGSPVLERLSPVKRARAASPVSFSRAYAGKGADVLALRGGAAPDKGCVALQPCGDPHSQTS